LAWNGSDKPSGKVIKAPGVPDRYDYERIALAAGPARGVAPMLVSAQKLAKLVDGIFVPSSSCIEPVGAPQCREFHQARGQELFTVGLQTHESCWTDAPSDGPTNEVVKSFLDGALQKYGHKSVLYISFGCAIILWLFHISPLSQIVVVPARNPPTGRGPFGHPPRARHALSLHL
jgi:hypothetical protein